MNDTQPDIRSLGKLMHFLGGGGGACFTLVSRNASFILRADEGRAFGFWARASDLRVWGFSSLSGFCSRFEGLNGIRSQTKKAH